MAGTDTSQTNNSTIDEARPGPAIILISPQLGENIGMCCRAMLNCGLTDLRIVNPRIPWPNDKGRAAASGADEVVDKARVFTNTEDALADLQKVFATTARARDLTQHVCTPKEAAIELHTATNEGQKTGIMFGPEAKGLNNDDVVLADAILAVPLNPAFKSLNLAQAVFCASYEWYQASLEIENWQEKVATRDSEPATKQEMVYMFEHLEKELDDCGFLRPPEKRPNMVRNIRSIFQRASMTEQEVRTMRGVISGLVRKHLRTKPQQ